jgi:hypothetical protein
MSCFINTRPTTITKEACYSITCSSSTCTGTITIP